LFFKKLILPKWFFFREAEGCFLRCLQRYFFGVLIADFFSQFWLLPAGGLLLP